MQFRVDMHPAVQFVWLADFFCGALDLLQKFRWNTMTLLFLNGLIINSII